MPDLRSQSHDHLRQVPLEKLLELGLSAVDRALEEDASREDAATRALFAQDESVRALILAKEPGVIAGLPVARRVFETLDPSVKVSFFVDEGERVEAGDVLGEVFGPAHAILGGERTALNFLQRMSGIATRTARFAREIATTRAALLDTRKTAPGLRPLDKYAVRVGGGRNHRLSLSQVAMIKDTHIAAAGSITLAIESFRKNGPAIPLEVEARSLDEVREVLQSSPLPDRMLLDNLSLHDLKEAVDLVAGQTVTEASGGITLETIAQIAQTGVDSVSVGELTHSVQALDISMEIGSSRATEPIDSQIKSLRKRLGERIVHLAHHYTRDSVVKHADVVGDSLALARTAAETDAEIILFSGVHFMGETAAILCRDDQRVVMPAPDAGCFLADCAILPAIEAAWKTLGELVDATRTIPVTYVNSAASLKAFCGKHRGIVCTSTNAAKVLAWALSEGDRVFFFPDRNLGENTARAAGIGECEIYPWPPSGKPDPDSLRAARVIAWPGVCNVHRRFVAEHIDRIRGLHPQASIVVHPECSPEVVARADFAGSTSQLIRFVEEANDGHVIAVGTEARLVRRLQALHPKKTILNLADVPPYCRTMSQTTPADLLAALSSIETGTCADREIHVEPETARWARAALDRMLEL